MISETHYNRPEQLPPVGTVVVLKLISGATLKAIRLKHIANRGGWLGYRMESDHAQQIDNICIEGWRYE